MNQIERDARLRKLNRAWEVASIMLAAGVYLYGAAYWLYHFFF